MTLSMGGTQKSGIKVAKAIHMALPIMLQGVRVGPLFCMNYQDIVLHLRAVEKQALESFY